MSTLMCRTCLDETVQMQSIQNTKLQEVYEKLTNTKLVTEDGKPTLVCCPCYFQLQRCLSFSVMSQKADSLLTQLYRDGIEITQETKRTVHRMFDSLCSVKMSPLQPAPSPLEEHLISIEAVKEEPDPVEVEVEEYVHNVKEEVHRMFDSLDSAKMSPLQPAPSPLEEHLISIEAVKEEPDPVEVEVEEYVHNVKEEDTRSPQNDRDYVLEVPQICMNDVKTEQKIPSQYKSDCKRKEKYTCDVCTKTFNLKTNLKSHMKVHKKTSPCDRCSKVFRNPYELKRHLRCHTGERPYACDECDKTYSDIGNLNKHKISHGDKLYNCKECDAAFTLQGNLRRHCKRYHNLRAVRELLSCDYCDKKFKHQLLLKRHIASHTGEKPFPCPDCDKTFAFLAYLKAHAKTHSEEKSSSCDRCGKSFLDKYRLKRHMKSHSGDKPYACDHCYKTYSDRGNLKKHIMDHTRENLFSCSECDASFTRKGSLQRHLRCHTGEKPFSCDICQKCLSTSTHLKRHMKIHTGEKPFVCKDCGKAYAEKDDCKKHMTIHSGEKPYICSICDYRSYFKKALKLHVASKHPSGQF